MRVRSAVVPRFRFRKASTQNSAEAYGVKAVMMTALGSKARPMKMSRMGRLFDWFRPLRPAHSCHVDFR